MHENLEQKVLEGDSSTSPHKPPIYPEAVITKGNTYRESKIEG